jgi:hypothetical protein
LTACFGTCENAPAAARSLARITGISQPHLHPLLSGSKALSLEKANQILRHLHLDLVDLGKSGD